MHKGVRGEEQLDLALTAATFAKNSGTWSSGRPPFIAAFGRIPRHGLNLLSDQHGLVFGGSREYQQQLADVLRAEAQQQVAAMAVDSSFRRALLRKTNDQAARLHPDQAPIGSIVAYWRWTARSGKKRGGYRLARLLGRDPDGKSYWLQSGTNTIKVAQHQLRLAYGFEQWEPDQQDVRRLKDASDNIHRGDLLDEQLPLQQRSDPEQPQGSDGLEDDLREFFDETQTVPVPAMIPVPPPEAAAVQSETQEATAQTDPYQQPDLQIQQNVQQQSQQQQTATQYNLNIHSPTYRQTNIHNTGFGFPSSTTPVRTPMRRARSRTPTRQLAAPETPTLPIPTSTDRATGSTEPQPLSGQQQPSLLPPQATSTSAPTLIPPQSTVDGAIDLTQDDDATTPLEDAGNMVPRTPPGLEGQNTPVGSTRLTPSKRSLAESGADEPQATRSALITCMDAVVRLQKHDDYTCFFQNYGCRNHGDKMSVWARLDFDNQVLKTTHVTGPRKTSIKHRRVIDVFTGQTLRDEEYDPQLDETFFTSTPCSTITELWFDPRQNSTFNTLICENDEIHLLDDSFDGSEEIYASPLYEIRGNVYGLANAPRTWSLEVTKRLKGAGYEQHSLDRQLYLYWGSPPGHKTPILLSLCIVYVDDFLLCHSDLYDRNHILALFKWGSQQELSVSEHIEFKGKEIRLRTDSPGHFYLKITQEKFIDSLTGDPSKLSKEKAKTTIDASDLSELRSVGGCLQWVAGQTRPDVAATVSLSSRGGKTTYGELNNMYLAVEHLKATRSEGFLYDASANQRCNSGCNIHRLFLGER